MSAPTAGWTELNQLLLTLELTRLRLRLAGETADATLDARIAEARAKMPAPAAIDRIVEAFDLSPFERDLLLLCAGVEMDAQLALACRAAGGRSEVTFALALAALDAPHWSALTRTRPLRRWCMVEVEAGALLTLAALRIDERVLHFVAGIDLIDHRLAPLLTSRMSPRLMAAGHEALVDTVREVWQDRPLPLSVVHLGGDDQSGAEDIAAAASAQVGLQLHVIDADDLPPGKADIDTFSILWEREAVLLPSALLVQCGNGAVPARVAALAERIAPPLLIASHEPPRLRRAMRSYDVHKPDSSEQKRLWTLALGDAGASTNGALDGVAAQFRFSARTIAHAGQAVSERVAAGEGAASALWNTCRSDSQQRLDELAQRIPPAATWQDLVLPEPQLLALRQIAAQVRQRARVYDEWGFGRRHARGLGVTALFSGGSGTGKTLAAEVLASALRLDLYRIDLSSVVSKYIGETEKNLRRVFDAAEDGSAILLFDEADALFGKRSEVKDSHDRYANIEVAYLLQRMESYRGLAILTTNLKSSLDPAFQRRLRFMVQFPFPDASQREAIWRLTLPATAPSDGLDFSKLARLSVAGGGVRNIALNAAFLAAEANEPITMQHLLAAAHAESVKLERPLGHAEVRGWT